MSGGNTERQKLERRKHGEAEKEKVQKDGGCRNHPYYRLNGLDRGLNSSHCRQDFLSQKIRVGLPPTRIIARFRFPVKEYARTGNFSYYNRPGKIGLCGRQDVQTKQTINADCRKGEKHDY